MRKITVVGHRNPDTDSIVTSLVLGVLLKKRGKQILGFSDFKVETGRAGELNKETKFVLNYFNQETPALIENIQDKEVFLVDCGKPEQSIEGLEESRIVAVLDHHRMGGIKTSSPIFYRAEPQGSSSTILTKMFLENNISLNKKQAGLLLAGVLSDTLNLSSPTTTQKDKEVVKILSKISGEKPEKLAGEMFKAKSDISDIPTQELVRKDYKEYEADGLKFGIGVWETTNPSQIEERKKEIISSLKKLKKERKLKLLFFASVDILKREAKLFLVGEKEKEIAQRVFKKEEKSSLIFLPGVVSRKKQILPPLINFLKK